MTHLHSHPRQLIAEETARLLHEEGYRDYLTAKTKAAKRLGLSNQKKSQPTNIEVHEALLERIALYSSEKEIAHLKHLRSIAIEAMEFLSRFKPKLIGPVLNGTAGLHTPITLHIFPEVAEDAIIFLDDSHIPFQTHERKHQLRNTNVNLPLLRFYVNDIEVELVLFDHEHNFFARCPIFGKKIQRADVDEVKALIAARPQP